MTDYVYCVVSSGKTKHLTCDAARLAPIMLRSLRETNPHVTVLMPCFLSLEQRNAMLDAFRGNMSFYPLAEAEIPMLMITKILKLPEMPFRNGDRVFVLDVDLLVRGPLFDVFDDDHLDVAQTTRHYDYHSPINNGVFCFRYNDRTRRFLDHYADELRSPQWEPYKQAYPPHTQMHLSDQAYMLAVYLHGPPVPCQMKDIGPMYNYCPADDVVGVEGAKREIREAVSNPDIRVIHFKGDKVKGMMLSVAEEQGWT